MTIKEIIADPQIKLPSYEGFIIGQSYMDNPALRGIDISLQAPDSKNLFQFHLNLYDFNKNNTFSCYMKKTSYYQNPVYSFIFLGDEDFDRVIAWVKSILLHFHFITKFLTH